MSDTPKPHSFFPRASNTSVLATFIAIVGCFLALGLIVWLAYLPNRGAKLAVDMSQVSEDQRWRYTAEGRKEHLLQMRAKETEALNSYVWVDKSAGVVRVPVERAMELIVEEQKGAKH